MADLWAPAAEPTSHLRRGTAPALLINQLRRPDPDRVDAFTGGVPAVTVLVPPLLVRRVRRCPVNLDARPVPHVQVVQVAVSARVLDQGLPGGGRQSVGALHP